MSCKVLVFDFMKNFAEEFKQRTKLFALEIIKFSRTLSKTDEALIIKEQLLRSSFSVAANYRAVCRARSDAEFYSKLCIVVEEADESVFWLEILIESEINSGQQSKTLLKEMNEILAIVSKSKKTFKLNQ